MNVAVIHASRHGSTAEVVDAIAAELRAVGHEIRQQDAAAGTPPESTDAVVVGSGGSGGRRLKPARE